MTRPYLQGSRVVDSQRGYLLVGDNNMQSTAVKKLNGVES